MSMCMSSAFLKSSRIINFDGINSISLRKTTLTSSSRFHLQQLQHDFHHHPTRLYYPRKHIMTINGSTESSPPPSSSIPPSNPFSGLPGRKGWIAGLVISLLLPFLRNKWGPLFSLKTEMDKDIEIIEETVEVLENVAEGVEKVAEEVAEELPQGEFKNVVTKIEEVAEMVAETAHLTESAIDKVQELEDEVVSYVTKSKTNPNMTGKALHSDNEEE